MRRVDFSANAPVYDQRHGAVLADALVRALTTRLRPGSRILDIGAGTGRVSVALAGFGFEVIAIEPSIPMLQGLREKAGTLSIGGIAAEGSRLPVRDRVVDAVAVARLLYLVPDWRGLLREASRSLRDGGWIFHEWGNGTADEDWVLIREKARALFAEAGFENAFHPGARTELEVEQYLNQLGFRVRERIDGGPGPVLSVSDFLVKIESGEVSYVWSVPKEVRDLCLPRLRAWAEAKFDMTRPTPMPAVMQWSIYELVPANRRHSML